MTQLLKPLRVAKKQTVVVKLGGAVVLDPAQVALVADELKAILATGRRVVLVHGGGPQLDKALSQLGEPVQKIQGLRVTSQAAAQVVWHVMDGIGASITAALNAKGVPATHVAGSRGVLEATPKHILAGDLGRVGTVHRFDTASAGCPDGGVCVVTPVGFDAAGPLNVNADEGACAVAWAVKADWLILGTDVSAVRDATGQSLQGLDVTGARALIASGAAQGGMIPKLESAVQALERGVARVLITKIQPGTVTNAVLKGKAEGTLVQATVAVAS